MGASYSRCSSFPRKRESSFYSLSPASGGEGWGEGAAFRFFATSRARASAPRQRVTFCWSAKSHQKTIFVVRMGRCPRTARPCCWPRTRASLRASYPRYKPAGDWYQASCNPIGTKPWSVMPARAKVLFRRHVPWLCEVQTYKNLYTGRAQSGARYRAQDARGPCTDQGCPFTDMAVVRKKGVSWLLLCTSKEVTRGLQPRKLCLSDHRNDVAKDARPEAPGFQSSSHPAKAP